MLAVIFLILSVSWLVIGFAGAFSDDSDHNGVGMLIIILALALNIVPLFSHINDLTLIRNQKILIDVREDAINRINTDLKEFPQGSALMNADSPVSSMIATKSEYIKELTDLKIKVAQAKINIERSAMGPDAWVVWILGKE